MAKKVNEMPKTITLHGNNKENSYCAPQNTSLDLILERVTSRITPTWDTRDYVAVNPLFGYRNTNFLEVIDRIQKLRGTRLLPSRSYLSQKYWSQQIQDRDLTYALMLFQGLERNHDFDNLEFDQLIAFLDQKEIPSDDLEKVNCLTDLYDQENQTEETIKVTNEVSKWLAAYYDQGQSVWRLPKNPLGLYATWKNMFRFDGFTVKNNKSFVEYVKRLPNNPRKTIELIFTDLLDKLLLSEEQVEIYFERLLFTVFGWATLVKKYDFENQLFGNKLKRQDPTTLLHLIAIRLTYDVAYLNESLDFEKLANFVPIEGKAKTDMLINYIWLLADEVAVRRMIVEKMNFKHLDSSKRRPLAQMAFCIDVRSEVIRREIEKKSEEIETIGFAGFFGVPIALKKLGFDNPDHQCPVLLKPVIEVTEKSEEPEKLMRKRRAEFLKRYGLKNSQQYSHSSFSLAESFGISYAWKMLLNNLGLTKPNYEFENLADGLELDIEKISLKSKVDLAFNALFNMGLTENLGKYVIFFGHGGESANNPYQGALDCGACAGHNGRYNAEFLAKILNDENVRNELNVKGVSIPVDTHFCSGWHNTTTDELNVHKKIEDKEFKKIMNLVEDAVSKCKAERFSNLIGNKSYQLDSLKKELRARSRNWSETRPEWGLARNHSFIVGRRELTRTVDLQGRSFLHDYNERTDPDLLKLELIMTAPMIVTNWINMQYYSSTIDPEKFGTGNKVLNNVVGTIGCIQGNQSDLLTGLSEQSVRLNGNYFHEPIRLQVFIEAKTPSIDKIINKHPMVSELVSNNWLHIISIDVLHESFKLRLKNKWIDMKEALWN